MARRFPVLALECGALKPSDANATVDIEKTFELWQRQIVTECSVATDSTFSALLQIARRMTYLTRQHKQDYKKDLELEDIVNWTTGVDEVLALQRWLKSITLLTDIVTTARQFRTCRQKALSVIT